MEQNRNGLPQTETGELLDVDFQRMFLLDRMLSQVDIVST
jgi:hypothetical protein